jgi:hypothetical protein
MLMTKLKDEIVLQDLLYILIKLRVIDREVLMVYNLPEWREANRFAYFVRIHRVTDLAARSGRSQL